MFPLHSILTQNGKMVVQVPFDLVLQFRDLSTHNVWPKLLNSRMIRSNLDKSASVNLLAAYVLAQIVELVGLAPGDESFVAPTHHLPEMRGEVALNALPIDVVSLQDVVQNLKLCAISLRFALFHDIGDVHLRRQL